MMRAMIGCPLSFALIVVTCGELAGQETSPTRPNFVFVMADDLGWADVAFHGGNAPTPHLDQLAREGLELTQHYVAPVGSPTRAKLPERAIYLAGPRWRSTSLRYGDWKLVVTGQKPKQSIELFNLATDLSEESNLRAHQAKRVEAMLKQLEDAAKSDRDSVVRK